MTTGFCKVLFVCLVLFCFTGAKAGGAFTLPSDFDERAAKYKWGLETSAFFEDEQTKNRFVALLIDKDTTLSIDFVTYLVSNKIGYWQGCNPFMITAVTNAEDAFDNNESRANLIASAKGYADILCPNAAQMRFFASGNADFVNGSAFFSAILNKNKNGEWVSEVEVMDKNMPALTFPLEQDEKVSKDAPFSVKVAFAHGKKDLDNPAMKLKVAKLLGHPVDTTIIVHIKTVTADTVWVDWPFPIAIDNAKDKIRKTGWFLISGAISPFPDRERIRMGIRNDTFSALLYLTNATSCLDEKCHNLGKKYMKESE